MKINEILAEASALGSILRGAGATQGAAAADAYALAQQRNPQAKKSKVKSTVSSVPATPVIPTSNISNVRRAASPATDELYSIGGQKLDPSNPSDKAIIDKLKTAQAAEPKTAPATKPATAQPAGGKFEWDEEVHTTDATTPAPAGWVKLKIPPSIQPGNESPYRLVNRKYAQDWLANGWVMA